MAVGKRRRKNKYSLFFLGLSNCTWLDLLVCTLVDHRLLRGIETVHRFCLADGWKNRERTLRKSVISSLRITEMFRRRVELTMV
jgi:hypothetical protein